MSSAKASLKAMAQDAKTKKKSVTSKKASKPAPAPFKSAEFIQESDEEDEETKSDSESDSDDESLPENPADAMAKANGKLPAPSGSSSSSDNESSSDESSAEEETDRRAVVEPEPTKQRPRESSTKKVAFDKALPYKPPTGFQTASILDKSSASVILKKSNLKDKQLWYFTAPASIPISTIEQMSLADVEAGQAILDHDGGEYGFVQDSTGDKIYTKIMVPSSSEDAYHTASKSIDRVLHLQQIVKLPDINDAGASLPSPSRATVPIAKPIRQQPEGLKMRFRPIGFGKGELGKIGSSSSDDSDEEMDDAPTVFHRPTLEGSNEEMEDAPPTSTKSKQKRKHESAEPTSSAPKKRKHDDEQSGKKSSSQQTDALDDRALKKLKKKQKESRKNTANSPSASTEPMQPTAPHSHKPKHATLTTSNLASSPILPSSSRSEVKASQEQKSSHKHHKKRSHDKKKTPSKKDDVSLHELTKATDPSLTGEKRRKEIKKLKHKDPR